jgi:hypothetical protein
MRRVHSLLAAGVGYNVDRWTEFLPVLAEMTPGPVILGARRPVAAGST